MKIVWILGNEAFQKRRDDVEGTDAIYDLWIEILHFLAVAFMQNPEPISSFDIRLGAPTRDAEKQEKNQPWINTGLRRASAGQAEFHEYAVRESQPDSVLKCRVATCRGVAERGRGHKLPSAAVPQASLTPKGL